MAAKSFPFVEKGSWFSSSTPSIKDGMAPESEVFRLWEAVAAASLLVALKLHNSPNPIQYVANVFASTCYERLSKQQRSRELIEGFKHLRNRGMDKTWFHTAWKKLVDALIASMRVAERKVLCSTGFTNLPDMSWEWDMLSKIEKQLHLRDEPKWLPSDTHSELSIDPLSTVKCVEAPSAQLHLSGRQLAEQFLINSARLSPAHCRFTASVVALAAIKNSCDAKGIKVLTHCDSSNAQRFRVELLGVQHDRSLTPEQVSEEALSGCIICVVRARDELYNLLKKLKAESQQPQNRINSTDGRSPKPLPHHGSKTASRSTTEALPQPCSGAASSGVENAKREREELEEGECVWGDDDVGEPSAKKPREDEWQPPAIDQPVDDAWRPQAPPPPPSHPDTPPPAEVPRVVGAGGESGVGGAAPPGDASVSGHQSVSEGQVRGRSDGGEQGTEEGKAAKDSKVSEDESLEEGEVR